MDESTLATIQRPLKFDVEIFIKLENQLLQIKEVCVNSCLCFSIWKFNCTNTGLPKEKDNSKDDFSGWITASVFLEFLHVIVSAAQPSEENPLLLIRDNHESYLSVEAIQVVKDNHVIVLALPPYT